MIFWQKLSGHVARLRISESKKETDGNGISARGSDIPSLGALSNNTHNMNLHLFAVCGEEHIAAHISSVRSLNFNNVTVERMAGEQRLQRLQFRLHEPELTAPITARRGDTCYSPNTPRPSLGGLGATLGEAATR